jgi:hypothetical protein
MNESINEIKIVDIPNEFFESTTKRIVNYLIGMVKPIETENRKDAELIGSGTLVDINGVLGVLTAQHVIDALPSHGLLGLILSEKLHRPEVDVQTLAYSSIGKSEDDSAGPDLGFIKLPENIIGTLKAHKSFYNISKRQAGVLYEPPQRDLGLWCLCGIPDEKTITEGPHGNFQIVKNFLQFCVFGEIADFEISDEFDYFHFDVQYDEKTEAPTNYGGVSGGGLWQVLMAQDVKGQVILEQLILSGVAFYQFPLVENRRVIKCHGRRSIYAKGRKAVETDFC